LGTSPSTPEVLSTSPESHFRVPSMAPFDKVIISDANVSIVVRENPLFCVSENSTQVEQRPATIKRQGLSGQRVRALGYTVLAVLSVARYPHFLYFLLTQIFKLRYFFFL